MANSSFRRNFKFSRNRIINGPYKSQNDRPTGPLPYILARFNNAMRILLSPPPFRKTSTPWHRHS
jgi:hypothetical protein